MSGLVLSLFPGIGLLDMAFEEEGFCVVRGPDLLWGGDVRRFHPTRGRFDGIIGGPPCQSFSTIQKMNPDRETFGDLMPEYERCVREAQPAWFLSENVENAPLPSVDGYTVRAELLNNRWLGEAQSRRRRFCFGTAHGAHLRIEYATLDHIDYEPVVTAGRGFNKHARQRTGRNGHSMAERLRLQGLPSDFLAHSPFTVEAKQKAIGNGVPLSMGRAVARAVKNALAKDQTRAA